MGVQAAVKENFPGLLTTPRRVPLGVLDGPGAGLPDPEGIRLGLEEPARENAPQERPDDRYGVH